MKLFSLLLNSWRFTGLTLLLALGMLSVTAQDDLLEHEEFAPVGGWFERASFDSAVTYLDGFSPESRLYKEALTLKSFAFMRQPNYKRLEQVMEQLLRMSGPKEPGYLDMLNWYGLALKFNNKLDSAYTVFVRGFMEFGDPTMLNNLMTINIAKQRFRENLMFKLPASQSGQPAANLLLGVSYLETGHPDTAMIYLEQHVESTTKADRDWRVYASLVRAADELSDTASACKWCEEGQKGVRKWSKTDRRWADPAFVELRKQLQKRAESCP